MITTLIVDDQPDIRMLLRIMIQTANVDLAVVGEAADGHDALACFEALDPTVVVLDQMMPDMSGLEVAAEMRARRPHQVIVLCSAYLDAEIERLADELGITRCLGKDDIAILPEVIRAAAA